MNEQIVIDTDPGVDDALALVYSHNALLPVAAVSAVYGNAHLENVTRNAGYIIKSLGSSWKIYEGADRPLSGKAHLAESHGALGLGAVKPKRSEIVRPTGRSSFELFSKLGSKTKNTIFCLGPLTNIALMLNNPAIAQNIDRLIIIGGAFSGKGNVTYYAEFNAYNDPESFQMVMNQVINYGIDAVVIPAEVCRKVLLTKRDLEVLEEKITLKTLRQIVEPFIDYYMTNEIHGGYDGAVLYDVLAPVYYHHPELFTLKASRVTVELRDDAKRGQTIASPDPGSPIKICTNIVPAEAKRVVMNTLLRCDSEYVR